MDIGLSRSYRERYQTIQDSLTGSEAAIREFYRIRDIQNLYELGKTEKKYPTSRTPVS